MSTSALASSNGMLSGMAMQRSASSTSFSAMPPDIDEPITRFPGLKFVTPAPTASTTPATSPPGANGRSGLYW